MHAVHIYFYLNFYVFFIYRYISLNRTQTCTRTYIRTYIHIYTCMFVYIHTYMHTYLHTYVHTFIHSTYSTHLKPAWSPSSVSVCNIIEQMQRRFTKRMKSYTCLTYEQRVAKLNLDPFSYRRLYHDMYLFTNH